MTPLFERDGDDLVATILTQGPWHPEAQWGGPPCALLAWAVEQVPTLVPMRIARLTYDMHRVVPIGRLRVDTEVVREGKRLQVVLGRIRSAGQEVARVTALRLRTTGGPAQNTDPDLPVVEPPPFATQPRQEQFRRPGISGFLDAIEIRADHEGNKLSPAWFRQASPVVGGEDPSPVVRVAAVADFAANSGNYLDQTRWSSINPDLTITFAREPVGEWTAVATRSWYGADGIGHSRADLFDLDGFIGTATCSTLVDEVGAPYAG